MVIAVLNFLFVCHSIITSMVKQSDITSVSYSCSFFNIRYNECHYLTIYLGKIVIGSQTLSFFHFYPKSSSF